MDWDDLRFFLAVARTRGIAAAADELGVNQTTVSRRIAALEKRLAARLFDRLPGGYVPTPAGAAVLEHAARMDGEANAVERNVAGRDRSLSGSLRVTIAELVAVYLLLPRLGEFRARFPEIELEVLSTDAPLDLGALEADVAVRVCEHAPDDHLVGRRLATVRYAVYASKRYVRRQRDLDAPTTAALAWAKRPGFPPWLTQTFPHARVVLRFDSILSMVAGLRADLGLALLPCFAGEQEPDLVRVRTSGLSSWGIWVLSHADLRATARVKAFRDFVCEVFESQRALLDPDLGDSSGRAAARRRS